MADGAAAAQLYSSALKSLRAVFPSEATCNAESAYSPLVHFASSVLLSTAIGGRTAAAGVPSLLPDPSAVSLAADAIYFTENGGSGPAVWLWSQNWIDEELLSPQFSRFVRIFGSSSRIEIDLTRFQDAGKIEEVKEKARDWLYDRLKGNIPKKSLNPPSVDDRTRAVFCHALEFRGKWADKFFPVRGMHAKLHRRGCPWRGPFVTSNAKFCVGAYDGFKVLRLPYKKGNDVRQYSMYIILPDACDGISELEKRMASDPDFLARHIPETAMRLRNLNIPDGLNDAWFHTGTVVVWPPPDEYVDPETYFHDHSESVFNMGPSNVAEAKEGSGGASGCVIGDASIDFVADHPFIWAIREDVSGIVLFAGHFSDLSMASRLWLQGLSPGRKLG